MGLITTLGVSFFTILLGGIVFLQDLSKLYIRLFGAMCIFIVFWVTTNYLTNLQSGDIILIDVTNKLAFLSGYGVIFSGALFTYYFPNKLGPSYREVYLVGAVGLMTAISCLFDKVVGSAYHEDKIIMFTSGPMVWLYILGFVFTIYIIYRNLTTSKITRLKIQKAQARLILTAFLLSASIGLTLNLIVPIFLQQWHTTEIGPLSVLILVAVISYTIVRHGLFDIKLAAVRSVAYILSLIVLSAVYYVLAYIVSTTLFQGQTSSAVSISPINILLALSLAFIFQPIKVFFDKMTDSIFYRDRYHSDDFYTRVSEVLTATTDLRGLLQGAAMEIGSTLKAEQAFFFVQYEGLHKMIAGTHHHKELPVKDVRDLDTYVETKGDGILVREVLPQELHIRRILTSHKIAILMPLMRHRKVIGYLCLGDQRSSGYTTRDIKVLKTISDELIIAIQNALSVQEVRETNANLEQRISAATAELRTSNARLKRLDAAKDEFLSMASHQLRTPLTSVKGYLSMMLDGDIGKTTPMQKQVLEEAFSSSERMVHLIHDFLNVSRLQTGKFMIELTPVNLTKLIEEEVASLERVAKSRSMRIDFVNKAGDVMMPLDDTKTRQVVMNYIDNAIYYSHPDTTITVELAKSDEDISLKVKDSGIGVPKSEQSQLFEKFYRASNARKQRPDGTGVGIFLAKKVITGLGGEVIFESKEGQGSTFGFRLPYKPGAADSSDKTD